MTLCLNHVGFFPRAGKALVMGGNSPLPFEILRYPDNYPIFQGKLTPAGGDFGMYIRGGFSEVTAPGWYIAKAGGEVSQPFRIGEEVYDDAIAKIQEYFRLQRCGDTRTGWNGPCHLDDGIRGDTRIHQDVTGGWHDACDLRKWVSATIYGLLSLSMLEPFTEEVEEELRWGNKYFLAMQEPAGYLMDFIGGDYYVHGDSNRWTDNLSDGKDDRLINVNACDPVAQCAFIQAEALIAIKLSQRDKDYSLKCLDAALSCAAWLARTQTNFGTTLLGAAISAFLALAHASGDRSHQETAVQYARRLCARQVSRKVDSRSAVYGFFFEQGEEVTPFAREPNRELWRGCWPILALTDLLTYLPDHADAGVWRRTITLYVDEYLKPLADRNAFSKVPFGLFREDQGNHRALGRFWYRYFHPENPVWYVGTNANLASIGLALARAGRLMERTDWQHFAQQQLDWIMGCNPFNASFIMAVGHNNPQHMFASEFNPATPFLPGAVMNGVSGNKDDLPQLRPGFWQETEYWTPMVGYTLALLSELRVHSKSRP